MTPTQPTTLVRLRAPLVAREGQWLVVAPDGGVRAHDADDLVGLLAAALAPGYRVCGPVRVEPETIEPSWRRIVVRIDRPDPPDQGRAAPFPRLEGWAGFGRSGQTARLLGLLDRAHPEPVTAAALGAHLEIKPQSAFFHLNKLLRAGFAQVVASAPGGGRARRFGLTARGVLELGAAPPAAAPESNVNKRNGPHDRVLYALFLRGRTSSAASLTPMLPQDNPKAVAQHLVTLSKGELVTQLRSKIGLPHTYRLTAEGRRAMADARPVPGVVAPQPELDTTP